MWFQILLRFERKPVTQMIEKQITESKIRLNEMKLRLIFSCFWNY